MIFCDFFADFRVWKLTLFQNLRPGINKGGDDNIIETPNPVKGMLSGTNKRAFEDGEFYIPSGYDNILRNTYGDYMTLPPIEQQKPHHIQDVWWN